MGYICLVYRPQPLTKRGRRLRIRSEGKGGLRDRSGETDRQADKQRRASEDTPTERVASWIMGGPKADARPAALPCLRGLPWAALPACLLACLSLPVLLRNASFLRCCCVKSVIYSRYHNGQFVTDRVVFYLACGERQGRRINKLLFAAENNSNLHEKVALVSQSPFPRYGCDTDAVHNTYIAHFDSRSSSRRC